MLIRLGDAMVDSDEVVYAAPCDNDMEVEVLFKSHSKVFSGGRVVRVSADSPKSAIDDYLKILSQCLSS